MPEIYLPHNRDWTHAALDQFADSCLLHKDADIATAVALARGRLAYLATPYSKITVDDDGNWSQNASIYAAAYAVSWARTLAAEGVTAISPIIQAAEMVHADLDERLDPLDARFWENWCQPLLAASGLVIVPPIHGWDESEGVWQEVRAALRTNRHVFLLRTEQGVAS